ncbi:hypothetical protein G6F50_014326 [Rhizopus delemar]|uniref:Uncharacterized protein n=1 Tax=Rhizopus delemar TaxID=936053 RepID=A0A9P7C823_9FUNG|nr:hypothetical protein G6F50_014326 [Rhizopus delemar]
MPPRGGGLAWSALAKRAMSPAQATFETCSGTWGGLAGLRAWASGAPAGKEASIIGAGDGRVLAVGRPFGRAAGGMAGGLVAKWPPSAYSCAPMIPCRASERSLRRAPVAGSSSRG